jgi:thiol-disulfide isomerase/thioredoxin
MNNFDDEYKLVLFYANWCGHCKNYFIKDKNIPLTLEEIKDKKDKKVINPEIYTWQEIKDNIQKKCSILIEQYDEDEISEKYEKFINSYPTIAILKKEGDDYVYFSSLAQTKDKHNVNDILELIEECKKTKTKTNAISITNPNNNDFTFVLFYANWCGHCKNYFIKDNMVPLTLDEIKDKKDKKEIDREIYTWQEVKEYINNKFNINVIELEEGNPEITQYRDVFKGWPTLYMFKNENSKLIPYMQFKKNRTDIEHIDNFIDNCINNTQKGGDNIYRLKYKKYKQNYINLATKYNNLLNKYKQIL